MVSVRRSSISSFLLLVLASLGGTLSAKCIAQATTPSSKPETGTPIAPIEDSPYKIEPSSVVPGGQYTFVISAPDSACLKPKPSSSAQKSGSADAGSAATAKAGADSTSEEKHPFEGVTPMASSKSDLTLGTITPFTGDTCRVSLAGTVSSDANGNDLLIYLQKPGKTDKVDKVEILADLRLKVKLEKAPLPIPPGLAPEVDLMWKVLPRKVVADSFGDRVADHFFAIETVIGNNSGWDLQISALGFEMPYYDCIPKSKDADTTHINAYNDARQKNSPSKYYVDSHYDPCSVNQGGDGTVVPRLPVSIDTPTPIDAYPIVRSTIEREQHVGRRAVIINVIKATGSTLVGIGGLLPDAGNYVKTTSIINGPFEKGVELVYPDLTTLHLIGLDNRTLRDGTVISNNTSVRVNVFISREIVMCTAPKHWWYLDKAPKKNFQCNYGDARVPYQSDFNPADIRERLGELTVVGRKIQYLERVRVSTKTSDLPESKPGFLLAQRDFPVVEDQNNQSIVLGGTNLNGTTLVSGSNDLKLFDQKVSADGTSIAFKASVEKLKPPTSVQITATSSRGFGILSANVKAHGPVLSASTYNPATQVITVTGTYLDGASVTINHGKQDLGHGEVEKTPDKSGLTLKVDKALDANSDFNLIVVTDGGSSDVTLHTPAK